MGAHSEEKGDTCEKEKKGKIVFYKLIDNKAKSLHLLATASKF